MGVQRSVLCPSCRTPRVTKATGRQRLACVSCGQSWLVRDSLEAPEPAPTAALADAPAPAAAGTGTSSATGLLGGVDVLPPAKLAIGGIRFPEPAPPPAPAAGAPVAVVAPPDVDPAAAQAAEPAPVLGDAEPAAPAPVLPSPGRRTGYYSRIAGGRR